MWQRFTERARRIIFFSQEEAQRLGTKNVDAEHILLGLLRENDSAALRVLNHMGVPPDGLRQDVEQQLERHEGEWVKDMQLTPRGKRVIDFAYDEARTIKNNYIGTEHLLLGLIRLGFMANEANWPIGLVLAKHGVELERARREVLALQDKTTGPSDGEKRVGSTEDRLYRLLAWALASLPTEQRTKLLGEGMPLDQVDEALRDVMKLMFEHSISGDDFILDPKALVRVDCTEAEGHAEFTVITTFSFLKNLIVVD